MALIPLIVFSLWMMLVSPYGHLSGQISDQDARVDWGRHWVFVSLASCDAGAYCEGLAYQSTHPFVVQRVSYGGAAPGGPAGAARGAQGSGAGSSR